MKLSVRFAPLSNAVFFSSSPKCSPTASQGRVGHGLELEPTSHLLHGGAFCRPPPSLLGR